MFYFNPYALPPLFGALLIIALGIFVWFKNSKSTANFSWFLICLSMFVWLIGDCLLFSTKNPKFALFFTKIVYIGVTGIPIGNFYFSSKLIQSRLNRVTLFSLIAIYSIGIFFTSQTNLIINGTYNYFWGFYPKAGTYHGVYLIIWLAVYCSALLLLRKKINESKDNGYDQKCIRHVFYALSIGGILGPLDFIQKYGFEFYPVGYFSVPSVVGFISYSILKHKLLNIDIVIKKSVIYSILIIILTSIYLLIIILAEWLFQGLVGYKSITLSLFLVIVATILFNPLRNRIQMLIDKIFLGKTPQEMAQENELLKQQIEHSERLKAASTLALGLAHEIKNPITTIKTFAEYLPQKLDDKEFLAKFSKLIPAETERINNIIHQLLQFSKPSLPKFQQVRIHQLIQETLTFLNSEFLKRRIKLSESYENRETLIHADPEQIKQVLLNIIFNSMEAMPSGGTITIETKNKDDFVELLISDTGCGIPKEDLKHIFDPFFSKKESGTGLGLAIVHQIIKNQNGKIEVESTINKGTTFLIKLPLTKKNPHNEA